MLTTLTMPIRCGLVGCGMIADEYLETLSKSRYVEAVACTDLDMSKASQLADRWRIEAVESVFELIAEQRIDLLVSRN